MLFVFLHFCQQFKRSALNFPLSARYCVDTFFLVQICTSVSLFMRAYIISILSPPITNFHAYITSPFKCIILRCYLQKQLLFTDFCRTQKALNSSSYKNFEQIFADTEQKPLHPQTLRPACASRVWLSQKFCKLLTSMPILPITNKDASWPVKLDHEASFCNFPQDVGMNGGASATIDEHSAESEI